MGANCSLCSTRGVESVVSSAVSFSDLTFVNDAWSCSPNSSATNVNNSVLTLWDKNNPEVTNWCAPTDWRVDSNYIVSVDTTASSFEVTATVDFSKGTFKDGPVNYNMYLCGNQSSSGTWTYGDAYNADKSGNKHTELDLFETGPDGGSIPAMMQVTSHDASGNQLFSYVGFGGVTPSISADSNFVKSMSTSAVASQPMTLTWTVSSADNMALKVVQGSISETLDLGYIVKEYSSFANSSLSVGANNSYTPGQNTTCTTSSTRGYFTMSGLSIDGASTTDVAAAWSGSGSGTVQKIYYCS
eukprot:TRINITY_DN22104_c0_g5_i1.p1 TRINITY_DN22104_c0_g5~~TRINITY_DN22104_c0_g5_i1.p1  ORF type:complete len:300 (-),score=23.25 TRINITY_DN22104_c0_g5_i1:214-1113(-)